MKHFFTKLSLCSLLLLILSARLSTLQVQASFTLEEREILEQFTPVVEVLDLNQDGSLATPYIVNLTEGFEVVSRIIWHLNFVVNLLNYDQFGGDTALTNGVNVLFAGDSLLDNVNITENHEFGLHSYDVNVLSDEQSPKERVLLARWSMNKFVGCECLGLGISSARTLQFYVQDNITALTSITHFFATVEGYNRSQILLPQTTVYFDPLGQIEHMLNESGTELATFFIVMIGVMFVLIAFKRRK